MIPFVNKRYPILFFIIFFLILFRKVIFQGLMPIPSDLLVSFYFPFSSGGFAEYTPWVPNKAQVADDAIRQQYPWKLFAASQWKNGEIPLWNPYALSGYPQAANVQTGVFYPLNILFIILDSKVAWTILILLQTVLSFFFMYIFLRSIKLSKDGSLFGSLVFIGMSFELLWLEQMIIGHTTFWLPLILTSIQKLTQGERKWFGVGIFGVAMSILGGYSQTTLYVLIISASFLIFTVVTEVNKQKKIHLLSIGFLMFLLGIGLTAIQLIPTLEIYNFSAREGIFSQELYGKSLSPPRNLLTLISSDFFGNMATHNYWGDQHTDFNHFFGDVALVISITGLYLAYKKKISLKEGSLFFLVAVVALLCSLPTPLGYIPLLINIPILSTGVVARFLFIFQFGMAIVSAVSLHHILETKGLKIPLKPAISLLVLSALITIGVFIISKISSNPDVTKHLAISLKNMTFSVLIIGVANIALFGLRFGQTRIVGLMLIFLFASIEYWYLANKSLPFAKKEYLFPKHPLFTFLQEKGGIDRVWGQGPTYLTTNFPTVYSLFYSDGYDSLYIKRYGELIYSARTGKIPQAIPRSDVNLSPNKESWKYKDQALDLLGIKYIVDKDDNPKSSFEPDPIKFPPDRYDLIWQNGKFKVYENKLALPRIYFAEDIIFKKDDQAIINEIYQGQYKKKLAVVEEPINDNLSAGSNGGIILEKYTPNEIHIKTQNDYDSFLVISDNYFPGWEAKIDNQKVKVFRTNYTFIGIIIPKGNHKIVYTYEPISFKSGAMISGLMILLTIFAIGIYRGKSRELQTN